MVMWTNTHCFDFFSCNLIYTVVPVMNGHPRGQAKVSVHCRWPLIRGNLTLKCVGRGIDNVTVQGTWPLTTGVAQGRYYCIVSICAKLQTSSASASILINFFNVTTTPPCVQNYLSYQMCSNTIQKQVIMNIYNQDTFLQLYYARNVILGK